MTNSLKLRAAILERGFTQEQLAEQLGMTIATFNYKVNNKREFKASEIKKLAEFLCLTTDEVNAIFFCERSRMKFYQRVKIKFKDERMNQNECICTANEKGDG